MRYLIPFFLLFLVACNDARTYPMPGDLDYVEPMIATSEPLNSKYTFTEIITEEPTSFNGKTILRHQKRYTTEIDTIYEELVDDNYKQRELDLAEINLRDADLNGTHTEFSDIALENDLNALLAEIKIVSRRMFVYDSYSEASKSRQEILNQN